MTLYAMFASVSGYESADEAFESLLIEGKQGEGSSDWARDSRTRGCQVLSGWPQGDGLELMRYALDQVENLPDASTRPVFALLAEGGEWWFGSWMAEGVFELDV